MFLQQDNNTVFVRVEVFSQRTVVQECELVIHRVSLIDRNHVQFETLYPSNLAIITLDPVGLPLVKTKPLY